MNGLKITFTGDLMLGGDFLNNTITKDNFDQDLFSTLKQADYIITNFENIIGKYRVVRQDKDSILYCTLKTFNSYIKLFPNSLFCLGNNHVNDFGEIGFKETVRILKSNKIRYYGAGLFEEAKIPLVIEDKVILLSFSTDEFFVNSKIASKDGLGCCRYNINEIKNIIDKLDLNNKILIITLHWGYEHIIIPSPEQVDLAHQLIELGADLIIGGHPHIIQIYENYRNKYIFYSLGNYFFPNFYRFKSGKYNEWMEKNNRSFLVQVDILEDNSLKVSTTGLFFKSRKFKIKVDKKSQDILNEISKSFQKIFYNCDYKKFFEAYLNDHYPPYLNRSYKSRFLNFFLDLLKMKRKFNYLEVLTNIVSFKNIKSKLRILKKKLAMNN